MSEPTPEAPVPTEPPTPPPAEPVTEKSFTQDDVNAMLAKQKREQFGDYGDLKAQAARLAELEESQRTEAEKVAARAATAEKERDEARAQSLRYDAAITHGVGKDYFDLLGSGTEEEIASRAERVGGLLKVQSENEQLKAELEALRTGKPAPLNGRPVEALKPGATPTTDQTQDDLDYAALFGANG